jgi:hypothetical protein
MRRLLLIASLGVSAAFGQSIMLVMGSPPPGGATVATPTDSPGAGTYGSTQSVTLSDATGSAVLCYRVDGAAPTAATAGTCDAPATTYSGAFNISATATLKAIGTKVGLTNSGVLTSLYTISGGSAPTLISSGTGPLVITSSGGISAPIDTTGANFLVLVSTNADTPSVSDSKSNTWHPLTNWGSGGNHARMWYAWNATTGTSHTFTVTGAGSSYYGTFGVMAFSNVKISSDPFQAGTDVTLTVNPVSSGTITTPSGANVVITAVATTDSDVTTWTVDSGFASPPTTYKASSSGVNYGFGASYLIQTTGSTLTPFWTAATSPSTARMALIAAFAGM